MLWHGVSPSPLYCLSSYLPYEVCQFTIVRLTLVRSTSPCFIFTVIKSFLERFLCSESSWTVHCLFNTKLLTLCVNGREVYTSALNFTHHSRLHRFVPDYKCIIFIYNFGKNSNKQIKITQILQPRGNIILLISHGLSLAFLFMFCNRTFPLAFK